MRRTPRAPGSAPPPPPGSVREQVRARPSHRSERRSAPRNQVVPVGLGVSLRVLSCSLLFPVSSPAPLDQEEEQELSAYGKRALCGPRARESVRPSPRLRAHPARPSVYGARLSHFSEDRRSHVPPGAHSALSVSTCVSPLTVRRSRLFADSRSRGVGSRPTPGTWSRPVPSPAPPRGAHGKAGSRAAGTFRSRTSSVAQSRRFDCESPFSNLPKPLPRLLFRTSRKHFR